MSVHDIPLAHARLSASGAHGWLNCSASAWASAQFPDESSEYADEGTRAHGIGADCLIADIDVDQWCVNKFGCEPEDLDDDLYPIEMFECAQDYVDYVRSEIAEAKLRNPDAYVYIETRVDFSPWVREGFGTGDAVIMSDRIGRCLDYKHGKGVFVDVEDNEQLMLYALGAWNMFHHMFDIDTWELTIYQPRVGNIKTWSISVKELLHWAETVVKPTAARVWFALETGDLRDVEFNPKDEDVCRFCKARRHCRVRADQALDMAQYTKDTALLTDDEVVALLPQASLLKKWANDIATWAQAEAVKGKKFAGMKLVEGRSNRKYTDDDKVKHALILEGFKEDQFFKPKKLLGITAMEKLLKGKKAFNALLGSLVTKPKGKPTLVSADDPREALVDAKPDAASQGFD